jgi:hypothetical protein
VAVPPDVGQLASHEAKERTDGMSAAQIEDKVIWTRAMLRQVVVESNI